MIAGIDSCRAGWIAIFYKDGIFFFGIYNCFDELMVKNNDLERILIDIPIGLSSKGFPRTIDAKLRKELKGRSSTVFNAPCRAAVYESDDEKAKSLNIKVEGKSLSIQSLNIRHKIRELDEYLTNKGKGIEIIESHPELCFKYLNKGTVVVTRKATEKGIEERLKILNSYEPLVQKLYEQIVLSTKRKDVKSDDIVDAICLCLVNKLGNIKKLSYLKDSNKSDEKGLNFTIAYYKE